MYYNAFDANDYGVLTHLYVTDEVTRGQIVPMQQNYVAYAINKDVPSGKNISAAIFDMPYEYMYMTYYLPPITGYYYMVVMADPFGSVQEANEQNNFFFIADANGYPYYMQNGIPMGSSAKNASTNATQPELGRRRMAAGQQPLHSPVTAQNRNAYTPGEIHNMLVQRKQSGELAGKIRAYDLAKEAAEIGGKN
jgi:hypothetical protein